MSMTLIQGSYIIAGLAFILALAGLSKHESAKSGNTYGIIGMGIALVITVLGAVIGINAVNAASDRPGTGLPALGLILVAVLIGAAIGIWRAKKVEMTGMPELIAMLHSFVGLAAVLVGYNSYLSVTGPDDKVHLAEVFIGVFIGAVTFTGSIIAFLKLSARMKSAPLMLPGHNYINLGAVVAFLGLTVWFVLSPALWLLVLMTIIALALGLHLVASIGGGDMPVVVSMLNSYSGWAAAAAGFMLNNDLLIITGALVGSSGAYLSFIMCKAMNRSFLSVIAGGFGSDGAITGPAIDYGEHREITAEGAAELLEEAHSVIITPGYGMAVAQAQYPVAELTSKLRAMGITVRFGIHPVAGRLPGHMNVLLAEANVPYDKLLDMEEINPEFPQVDVVLVLGANDVVNPAARHAKSSPIYGMPILNVDQAQCVMVVKRSMRAGFAGIENELFYNPKTLMIFGDAKAVVSELALEVSGQRDAISH